MGFGLDKGEEIEEVAEVEVGALTSVEALIWIPGGRRVAELTGTSTAEVIEVVTVVLVGVSRGALGVGIIVVVSVSRATGVFALEMVGVLMTMLGVLVSELTLTTVVELVETVD